jgi:hypothetical protein
MWRTLDTQIWQARDSSCQMRGIPRSPSGTQPSRILTELGFCGPGKKKGPGWIVNRESLTATVAGRGEGPTQKMTQFLNTRWEQRVNVSHSRLFLAVGLNLRVSVEDAGDCRVQPNRHVSARGSTIQHVHLLL